MIEKLNDHYSFTSPASVHDEEALTALQLAGRIGKKMNEVVEAQNNLETQTEEHLKQQDSKIEIRLTSQDNKLQQAIQTQNANIEEAINEQNDVIAGQINLIKKTTIPVHVANEVANRIADGTFEKAISDHLGGLNERVDTLLGGITEGSTSLDAEVIDTRTDFTGSGHANAGNAVRGVTALLNENDELVRKLLQSEADFPVITNYNDFESELTSGAYIEKDGENMGLINTEVGPGYVFEVTDFLSLEEYPELYVSANARYGTCIIGVYDGDKNPLATWGFSDDDKIFSVANERFTVIDALNISPKARFIRCGSAYGSLRLKLASRQAKEDTYNELKYSTNGNETEDVTSQGTFAQTLGSYANKNTGEIVEHEKCYCTGKIPVKDLPDSLFVTATNMYEVCAAVFYTASHEKYLTSGASSEKDGTPVRLWFDIKQTRLLYPDAVYVAFSSYGTSLKFETPKKETLKDISYKLYKCGTNELNQKKLYVAGDSFTAGDFTGVEDLYHPDIYDSKRGIYKTFPYWIAERNNMDITLDAVCGSLMALDKTHIADPENVSSDTRSPYSLTRYTNVPEDVDYVLIWFGINDRYHTELGSIDDETNETFFGAYNVVLKWFITNRPDAHIGLIVSNGSLTEEYREAVKAVGVKWGVPYLDLMEDPSIPMTLNKTGACSEAVALRNAQYTVSESNNHPNIKAHKILSNSIEAFMRRI